ncbi:SH3 domain-containing protein [Ancylobacter sp. FA202]|uniref:SH3 domain-containing protein n=1 Tax=Ancylobacter sp. FA202 TaxID=1111106 RepID=UPI000364572B|nr:SH3 domain-containing protein [Ancylobacter sp. FA202]
MPTSSQQPRGTGLSSSLISDFRTIVSSLEQEKAERHGADAEAPPAARPDKGSEPRSMGDVRSRLAALGDMSDLISARPAVARPETGGGSSSDSAQAARRRSFGSSARQPGEAETRRKRNASKDVITWQRLGVLAVFMAVVGGGAVLLQSLAAREEAKVAPEVIGNAAVASVAPSAVPPELGVGPATAVALVEVAPAAPTPAASSALVNALPGNSIPPVLRNAATPLDAADDSLPVTAFAAPEAGVGPLSAPVVPEAVEAEPAVASIELTAAPAPAALPKEVPLPPSRARERQVAALAAPPAEAQPAAPAETAEEGDTPAGFGGEPIGMAVTRRPVTMRAAPKRGAAAIGNLPAGQKVELVVCQQWCEIIVEGKRVFVYKSFIDTGGTAGSAAAAEGAGAAAGADEAAAAE